MLLRLLVLILGAIVANGESLDAILARMDQSVKVNPSFSADVQWDTYNKAIDDHEEKLGAIKLRRVNNRVIGRLDIEKPNAYVLHFRPDTWEKYLPKANTLDIYNLAKFSNAATYAVGLVFGISGAEMRKSFDVKAGGEETLNGIRTTRLELVPKDKKARELVAKAELWVPVGQVYSIRQKQTAPNGDYNLWNYSTPKINPALPASAFEFEAPAGVKRNQF